MAARDLLAQRDHDPHWQLQAKCRGLPTEIFFAADSERGERRAAREEEAKSVCRACPVQRECLRHALSFVEPWGVWGAMTPRERRRVGGAQCSLPHEAPERECPLSRPDPRPRSRGRDSVSGSS